MESTIKPKMSVIVCCCNSAERIKPTLEALGRQQCVENWEVVLVNNNSSDNTTEYCDLLWRNIGSTTPLRIVEEMSPGLSSARKKGVLEANGELILFCDDDNHLSEDYINNSISIMRDDQSIGALCGFNEPHFEDSPPLIVKEHLTAYACGHNNMGSKYLEGNIVPWGAGLVMRRELLVNIFENNFESLLSDRVGKSLSSGGDTELCYLVRLVGYTWKYDTRLQLVHSIPGDRLTKDYLKKIYYGFGKASAIIEWYYGNGDLNRIKVKLTWWKVFLKQKLYFLSAKKDHKFADDYRDGYIDQLKDDRVNFNGKRASVLALLSKLNSTK